MVFQDIWAGIWTEETHHSTALEGNLLSPKTAALRRSDERVMG